MVATARIMHFSQRTVWRKRSSSSPLKRLCKLELLSPAGTSVEAAPAQSRHYMICNFLCLIWLYIFPSLTQAQDVTISGNDPDYAGCVITFLAIDNHFSNSEIMMGECTVAGNGNFTVHFSCRDARLIFTRLGVFHARFYVEPGFSYEVKLPPRIDQSLEDKENLFFKEETVFMNILSVKDSEGQKVVVEKELNVLINTFNQTFNPLYDQLAVDAARKRPVARLDSMIHSFKENLPHTGNRYFDQYAFYCSGLLYYAAQRSGSKYISNAYFAGRPVLYDNDAYMELFNATYDRYFMYFGRTGDDIYNVVNRQGSFSGLKRLLAQDGVLPTDSLCELVILKNIYDEFYADRFSRGALLHVLDSAIVHTKIERHRELAGEIRAKIIRLLSGFEPPDFALYNQDNTLVHLQDYRGKYLYLMFCTTQNYVCLNQYELLEKLHQDHGKWLQIVVISADDRLSDMRSFREKNGYEWDFLHFANDPDVMKSYDVRMFPTCFLIDPEGKLTLSPAPAANEQLEHTLWIELNRRGLLREYIQKGWIEAPGNTNDDFNF